MKEARVGDLARAYEAPHETRSFPGKLYRGAKVKWGCEIALVLTAHRMPVAKPVGKPDAGNPHVRFDERGR